MEQNLECAITNIPNTSTSHLHDEKPKPIETMSPKKKSSGGMRFFRVALFRMRKRSSKPSALPIEQNNNNDDDGSKSTWKKLVGSMRPLHLQSNVQSPRSEHATTFQSPSHKTENSNGYASDFVAEEEPYSPYSNSPASSRYASAVGLNELVQNEEENEKHEVIIEEEEECKEEQVGGDGDEMIDAKAEEFITQFYKQMKLQRIDSVDLRYFERNARSLG